MAIVRFRSVDEFIQELKAEYGSQAPKPSILRLTNLVRDTSTLPVRHLSVLATIKAHTNPTDITSLECFCGR